MEVIQKHPGNDWWYFHLCWSCFVSIHISNICLRFKIATQPCEFFRVSQERDYESFCNGRFDVLFLKDSLRHQIGTTLLYIIQPSKSHDPVSTLFGCFHMIVAISRPPQQSSSHDLLSTLFDWYLSIVVWSLIIPWNFIFQPHSFWQISLIEMDRQGDHRWIFSIFYHCWIDIGVF